MRQMYYSDETNVNTSSSSDTRRGSYQSFRTRARIPEDNDEIEEPTSTNTFMLPRERFQWAAHKVITRNKLKQMLRQKHEQVRSSTTDHDQLLATQHPRNAGKWTILAFVNSASGGGKGKLILFDALVQNLGQEHVFDLNACEKGTMPMPQDTLLPYAHDPHVRVLVCGGDGTVGWIESSVDKVWSMVLGGNVSIETTKYSEHLPLAIMPLGTGNDLSRQFGWGGNYNKRMKDSNSMIEKVGQAELAGLDRWRCLILPLKRLDAHAREWVPKMFCEKCMDQANAAAKLEQLFVDFDDESTVDDEASSLHFFDGVFSNYFSIGFDAKIAFQFARDREEHPEQFTSALKNKIIYVQKSPTGLSSPLLRDKLRVMVTNTQGKVEELKVPKDCRALVLLNIQSYAGGHKLTRTGRADDGLIEVVFVSNAVRMATAFALSPVIPLLLFRVAAKTRTVWVRTKTALYCQVDGEPWLQSQGVVKINFHSRNAVLRKSTTGPAWDCCAAGDVLDS